MKTLFAAALFFFPLPAFAADTIKMTVVSDVPGNSGTINRTYTMSQSDMSKLITWITAAYTCSPQPDCTPLTLTEATTAWMSSLVQGTVDNVTRAEKTKAATDAAGGVVPINPQ